MKYLNGSSAFSHFMVVANIHDHHMESKQLFSDFQFNFFSCILIVLLYYTDYLALAVWFLQVRRY